MPLQKPFITQLQSRLTGDFNQPVTIRSVSPVSGGSINSAWCVHTDNGDFMLKVNSKSAYPGMFRLEAEGLATIRNTQTIAVPNVILHGDFDDHSFLLLEWIDAQRATPQASQQLGRQLAAMHRHTANHFGFTANNYMGSLPQSNRQHANWSAFFVAERLQSMVKLGVDKHLLNSQDVQNFEKLYLRLPELFAEEQPALIHGDLWGGNYIIGTNGIPYLIDPAVSYGHREFDLAMTTLFGGFAREFYEAYHEAYPLAPNWQLRTDLWNLYPLLLHLNLFGTGYLGQVREGLQQYV
ncbi:fructosamine kinase family protein [Mucilaginibacter sp. Bleaf8]|uniref:fructosamine kinase family protein n=1 Tax=Mucilaginibacter sp. Bleaf8 TaxID=2834430 RepID=UPI001BCE8A96|nr:fructosamine kinase family protein [Mucilaginibacter sp. Bleaf8]MBS7563339.1 fructosamine kinase family protein [Mucilaginibacter sp. Bleaf8]